MIFHVSFLLFSPELETYLECSANLHAPSVRHAIADVCRAYPQRARNIRAMLLEDYARLGLDAPTVTLARPPEMTLVEEVLAELGVKS